MLHIYTLLRCLFDTHVGADWLTACTHEGVCRHHARVRKCFRVQRNVLRGVQGGRRHRRKHQRLGCGAAEGVDGERDDDGRMLEEIDAS
jgi:hypothetical protein